MRPSIIIALYATLTAGCLRLGEERVDLDIGVGSGTVGSTTVTVHDRLAQLWSLEPRRIELWSQAPVIEITISGDDIAGSWTLLAHNTLADSAAFPIRPDVAVTEMPRTLPTDHVWRIDIPNNEDVTLQIAPPDADDMGSFRFAVMGDIQRALGDVHEVFAAINSVPDVRFVASTGDLTQRGRTEEYDLLFEQFTTLDVPYYTTVGNHELFGELDEWMQRFGTFNQHFEFKGAAFSLVDSANAGIDPLIYDRLDGWLNNRIGGVHYFFTHYPPIDPVGVRLGSFSSRREGNKLLARLAEGGIDTTFYGHIHSLYEFDNAGIPAFISGGGGALPERLDGIGRHFLVVDTHAGNQTTIVGVARVDE